MTSWDELFRRAADASPDVEEFYADYGAAPAPLEVEDAEVEGDGRGERKGAKGTKGAKGKGRRKGNGRGKGERAGKGEWKKVADKTQIEVVTPEPKLVESTNMESTMVSPDSEESVVPMQAGESFADACFAAALEHDEERSLRKPTEGQGKGRRRRYWRGKA